jgi:hypothetical protein
MARPSHQEVVFMSNSNRRLGLSNARLPSTTFHWKESRLAPAPRPDTQSAVGRPSVYKLRARDPRVTIEMHVCYVGGPEGMWLIQARGWLWRFSGTLSFADVLGWILRVDV